MNDKILIVGADRIMPKLFYFQKSLKKLGYEYEIYTHDDSEFGREILDQKDISAHMGPPHERKVTRLVRDGLEFYRLLRKRGFRHIELYSDYHVNASLMYWTIARLLKKKIILWCRGELYEWDNMPYWQKLYFKLVINFSDAVILKELYMRQVLSDAKILPKDNVIDIHNTVEVAEKLRRPLKERHNTILFLNMFKDWRNVGFCVDIAKGLVNRGIDFSMEIVGEKKDDLGLYNNAVELRGKISKEGLEDVVKIFPFTTQPDEYFDRAKIFLLPADLVYCNYALLEAMAKGLVPLAYNLDPGTSLIVEDKVSGFCLPLEPELWIDIIDSLLKSDSYFKELSQAAHGKVKKDFSLDVCFDKYSSAVGLID